ncbi:hypothetical protein ACFXTO_005060 [Malus domestica]
MDFHKFQKEHLDAVFVPPGVLMMLISHLLLLHKYLMQPLSTAIGYENKDKKELGWQTSATPAVISSNTTATINLASISLTLCSLIEAWMANSTNNFVPREIIHGNTHRSIISIKYICLLTCFLLAFSCFVQSTRHFFHSNYLLSTVGATMRIDVKKAKRAVQRGSEFWSLGLRALYFVLNFLLWFFGAIPMLASSSVTVLILSCHEFKNPDTNQLVFAL